VRITVLEVNLTSLFNSW